MSELSDRTASPNTGVLPGYALSSFTIADFGEAEAEFGRAHVATAMRGAQDLPPPLQDRVATAATRDVANRLFDYGSGGFDRAAGSRQHLPFLLYLALRRRHPQATRQMAADLLTAENFAEVRQAVLECAGYDLRPRKPVPPPNAEGPTGDSSSPSPGGPYGTVSASGG